MGGGYRCCGCGEGAALDRGRMGETGQGGYSVSEEGGRGLGGSSLGGRE